MAQWERDSQKEEWRLQARYMAEKKRRLSGGVDGMDGGKGSHQGQGRAVGSTTGWYATRREKFRENDGYI
eukprot:767755-Hanusia_phi.AAC.1